MDPTIALTIAIHGLIALVPTTENGTHYMTALLIDAQEEHQMEGMEMCPIKHHPELRFLVKEPAQCVDAGCTSSGYRCICKDDDLARKHIFLKFGPDFNPLTKELDSTPPAQDLPTNIAEAGRFSYVANLSQEPFGLTLDSQYLGDTPSTTLISRMKVPLQSVTACSLAGREEAGQLNVQLMGFRKLHDLPRQEEMSQALAQKVVLGLSIPPKAGVFLHISDFDGVTNDKSIELRAGFWGYQIDLSNQPSKPLDLDHPCNDTVARHFAMYYALAKQPIEAVKNRLIPHFRFTQGVRRDDIEPDVCKKPILAMVDRPACPVATINP